MLYLILLRDISSQFIIFKDGIDIVKSADVGNERNAVRVLLYH